MSLQETTSQHNLRAFALEAIRRRGRLVMADASMSPGEVEQEIQRRAQVIQEMPADKLASQLLLYLPAYEFHRC
jgi:hypothetical protein